MPETSSHPSGKRVSPELRRLFFLQICHVPTCRASFLHCASNALPANVLPASQRSPRLRKGLFCQPAFATHFGSWKKEKPVVRD